MPDIVIAGATFRNVPQIDIPKEGSGTASFVYEDGTKQITENGTNIDVSGYSAVDVNVSGGGGGGSIVPFIMRNDATLVASVTYDKYIVEDEQVTIPAYSTSITKLKNCDNFTKSFSLDLTSEIMLVVEKYFAKPIYNESFDQKQSGVQECYFRIKLLETSYCYLSDFGITVNSKAADTVQLSSLQRLIYMGGSTSASEYDGQYGAYISNGAFKQSLSSGTVSFTFNTLPFLGIRGNSTYLKSAAWSAITDIRYQYRIEFYKVPISNLNSDGWLKTQTFRDFANASKNNTAIY